MQNPLHILFFFFFFFLVFFIFYWTFHGGDVVMKTENFLKIKPVGGVGGFPTQAKTKAKNPISDSDGVDAQP
jgi:hypothetical protein